MKRGRIISGMILLIMGIAVAIVGGVFLGIYVYKTETCTLPTTGIVVDFDYSNSSYVDDDISGARAPVFCYEIDGELYTEVYHVYTNPSSYDLGDDRELLVNPDDPEDFILKDSIWMQLTSGICLGIGGLLFIIAIILLISAKRKRSAMGYQNATYHSYNSATGRHSVHQDTYSLNGEKYRTVDTEQQGYYNLNGEIHRTKDNDSMN